MASFETQWRATFEDTKQHQEKLRVKLDELDEKNRCVSEKDRESFFDLIADSLLGLDYEKQCVLKLSDNTDLITDNLGQLIRHLAYYGKTDVGFDFLKRYGKITNSSIKIGTIWHELKFIIYGIYPEALAVSVKISKERDQRSKSKGGFTFGKKKTNISN